MPIRHTPDRQNTEGITYTGRYCRDGYHETCPAWWARGTSTASTGRTTTVGTRCACPCHEETSRGA
jgi:hypothetical protein